MRPTPTAMLAVPVLAITLAACGSAGHSAALSSSPTAGSSAGASVPATTPASSAASSPVPSAAPSGGHDSIGGSVSTNLAAAPTITVPTGAAPSKLETKDIVVGHGPVAATADTVTVQYVGVNYANGKPFDSSWSRGKPSTFALSNVIPGFAQGIAGMAVGSRREIVIPAALGYGAQGVAPAIAPNENLIFVVDLLKLS